MRWKLNKLQRKILLNVVQIFLVLVIFWEFYWVLLYETLFLEKTFLFFRYLREWMIIMLAVIGLAVLDVAIEHPEAFKRRAPRGSEPGKQEPKKPETKKKKKKPLW